MTEPKDKDMTDTQDPSTPKGSAEASPLEALTKYSGEAFDNRNDALWRLGHLLEPHTETIRQALQAQQWQPIETAPRDGTWIVGTKGRCPESGLPYLPVIMMWNQGAWVIDSRARYEPTYWMPLPEPPQVKDDQGK